jgi:anti-sigma factor RsiW
MTCDDARDLLALFAGGELDEPSRLAVEAHVAVCGPCARDLDQYREARSALASLREPGAPPDGDRAAWESVRASLFPSKSRRPAWWEDVLRFAAVAVIGVAIGAAARPYLRPAPARGIVPVGSASFREAPPVLRAVEAPEPSPGPVAPPLLRRFHLPRVEAVPAGGEKEF